MRSKHPGEMPMELPMDMPMDMPKGMPAMMNMDTISMKRYEVYDGIELLFLEVKQEFLQFHSKPNAGVFAINHCEDGRIECKFDSGEYLYMGPGDMSVGWRIHDNYQHDSFFPTKQFRGVNLIVNVDKAQPVMDLLPPDSQIHLADIANRFCESSDFGMLIEETDSLK